MPMLNFASIALSLQLLVVCSLLSYSSYAVTFTITNKCPYTVWPGTLAGAGTPQLPYTGFRLDSGQSVRIPSVPGWSGRIWARTGCTFNAAGVGTCQTGDCGGKLECSGMGATPPASLFEITLGAGDDLDFYDVSIVDGYNLPVVVFPQGVHGNCTATGCASNINMGCPRELQVVGYDTDSLGEPGTNVIGCKSACGAFGSDQYCCSGEFANPSTCKPSFYSGIFKRACPRAYSYAFDDGTSTFTCKGYDYTIVFCPANGMSTNTGSGGGGALTAPPFVDTGSGGALTSPPFIDTGSGGAVNAPPFVDTGSGGALTSPPFVDTGSGGALTAPPFVNTGSGGALTAPPFGDTRSGGALTAPPFVQEIRHRKPRNTVSSSSPVQQWPFSMQSLILTIISIYF